jgi:hypothetical protein
MRWLCALAFLGIAPLGQAADVKKLPANTWVEIKYTTAQPGGRAEEKGRWVPAGWNKLARKRGPSSL